MSNLSPTEVLKYDWRANKFIQKYKDGEPFELVGGQKVNLVFEDEIYNILLRKKNIEYQKISFTDSKVKTRKYKFSSFKKTVEFGGKGEKGGAGVNIEMREINSINEQFDEIRGKTGQQTVTIRLKNKNYEAFRAIKTPGVPKSDFSILDANGNEIIWISHKEGNTSRDFQQWGGMTETRIQNHPEVQIFIQQIQQMYPDGIPNATTVAKMIKDEDLKKYSVYGVEYDVNAALSRQNVSFVLQGPVKLRRDGLGWTFSANHAHENGERITGDFEPVLMAIYKGDRSNFGVKGARFAIQPKLSRKVTKWLD